MLSYEKLETAWLKIEQVINGYPLVYLSGDDLGDALAPTLTIRCMVKISEQKIIMQLIPEGVGHNGSKHQNYISKLLGDQ